VLQVLFHDYKAEQSVTVVTIANAKVSSTAHNGSLHSVEFGETEGW
jgi:hypothetical protein